MFRNFVVRDGIRPAFAITKNITENSNSLMSSIFMIEFSLSLNWTFGPKFLNYNILRLDTGFAPTDGNLIYYSLMTPFV
jgi:hypothetical protein